MQGKIINGFTLQRLLGVGGMAEVWYAENEFHEPAIVRILDDKSSKNAQIVERFPELEECMINGGHQIYGHGTIDSRPAIVIEYNDKYEKELAEGPDEIFYDKTFGWIIRNPIILNKESDEWKTINAEEMQIDFDIDDSIIDLVNDGSSNALDGIILPRDFISDDDLLMGDVIDFDAGINDKSEPDKDDSLMVSLMGDVIDYDTEINDKSELDKDDSLIVSCD